ncbi:MAG: hypothetical protein U0704_04405 [Candidatus Eisenbacteria bacterium]
MFPLRSVFSRVLARALVCVAALSGCGPRTPAVRPAPVAVLPEYYAHSLAALGFPGHQRAFQCGDGAQLGAGDAAFAWTLGSGGPVRVSPVYFESDGVPVAHGWLTTAEDSAHYEAVAFRVPGATDTLLVASVRVAVRRRGGGAPSPTALVVTVRDSLAGPHDRPWDAIPEPGAAWSWERGVAVRAARVHGGVRIPAHWRFSGGGADGGLSATGTSADGVYEFWLTDRAVSPAEAKRLMAFTHEAHAARARAAWREWLGRGAVIATPDTLVNQAYRAAIVTLLQGQERSAGEWVPIGNPFQYRDTWLRDGARVVRALALGGWTELARSDAATFLRYQLPSGALISQYGQLDGTGQALWAFEQAASLPPDADVSRRFLPAARLGAIWIRNQRVLLGMMSRIVHVDHPDLLPFGDPRDGELVRAPLVGNDAWAIAGQAALAAMAARAGDRELAAAAETEGGAHRQAFFAALARSRHPDVPPAWDGGGRDWGNCYVGFPTQVLPANDARLARLAERLWARSGLHMVAYGAPDSLHTYLGSDLAVWALLAGRPADARASLADLLAHSSSTLGQAEIFSRTTRAFGRNLPPHGTAAAQLVELVRDGLVLEQNGRLAIAAIADSAWWRGAALRGAPTRYGRLDLSLAHPAADRYEAAWSAPGAPVALRVPDGCTLVRAEGGVPRAGDPRWVDCPAAAGRAVLIVSTP